MKKLTLGLGLLALAISAWGCGQASELSAVETTSPTVENSLEFSCADIVADGFDLTHSEATKRKMFTSGKEYPAMTVFLANYDRQGGSYHPNAKLDGQRRVILNFSASAGSELSPGSYSVDGQMAVANLLSIGIENSSATCGLSNGRGSGEILALDGSTISGRVSVSDDRGTTVEATFSVPYEVSPY